MKSLLFIVVLFFILTGCSQDDLPHTSSPTSPNTGNTVTISGTSSSLKDGQTIDGKQIAEGYGMTYSETAMDENIPALPIFGFSNGLPFNAGTVVFRQDHKGEWHLEVSDDTFDPLKGIAYARSNKKDLQTIYIHLPNPPAAGATLGREMEYGGGHFQIKTSHQSMDTTSWNTSFAYKIQINKWEMGPAIISSCGRPEVGQASGKLFISFKGSNDRIKNSWVSGQFNRAAIIYCGANS